MLIVEDDVVLLDLGLPDLDGLEVCRRIRAVCDVAIIVIAARGDEIDRVLGLETGADDYLVKPFSSRELVARLHAPGRRLERAEHTGRDEPAAPPDRAAPSTDDRGAEVPLGSLTLDPRTRTVTIDGRPVALTHEEFDLLVALPAVVGTMTLATLIAVYGAFMTPSPTGVGGLPRIPGQRVCSARRY